MPTYIRVRDIGTGHEHDCDERSLRPGMEPVPGYPPNSGPGATPRPAKHFVDKAGQPAKPRARTRTTPTSVDTAAAAAPTHEGQPT